MQIEKLHARRARLFPSLGAQQSMISGCFVFQPCLAAKSIAGDEADLKERGAQLEAREASAACGGDV